MASTKMSRDESEVKTQDLSSEGPLCASEGSFLSISSYDGRSRRDYLHLFFPLLKIGLGVQTQVISSDFIH